MSTLSREAESQVRRAERALRERDERRERLRAGAREAAAVLKGEPGATRVILFGSVLRSWFGPDSDLDLAVEGLSPERFIAALRRLEELLGVDVIDLVRIEDVDEGMRRRIEQSGEVLA